jgi:polysaccharide deacetylase family protein (PEP-CTERM system associated)
LNLLGIDFEDWYHPELVQRHIKTQTNKPVVINGIDKILEWLRKNETFATFFMVGELLEAKPELLDKILGGGHEIGFHTMHHTRLDSTDFREKFPEEIKKFHVMTKGKSKGFRAPTFSLADSSSWAIDILSENNYQYDSSIVPAKTRLYGVPDAQTRPYRITSREIRKNDPNGKILEFPLLTTKLFGRTIPACGGFYLRFLPLKIIEKAVSKNNEMNIPSSFYIHSWELTPEFMPRIPLSFVESFITYYNLEKTMIRLDKLIKKFKFTSFEKFLSSTSV